jgi:hypothetical protein
MGTTNTDSDCVATTFRPPWWFLTFWLLGSGGMLLLGLLVVGRLFPVPAWVRGFFVGVSALALLEGLVLAFAVVRVTREGLVSRHHVRWCARWEAVEAWSQWGPRSSIYVRTRDGRIRRFSSWCVYGTRCDQLARVLERQVGPGATGDSAIAPRPLKQTL